MSESNKIVSSEVWKAFSDKEKEQKIRECLEELEQIDLQTHPLANTKEAGKLSNIRVALEKFIISTATWESKTK